ncbi:RING finger domain-containing protein containing protein [Salpingoeca rosetta]|uniref:RING finger domain-containing protein containing protein n=1 Tax=Salpingoeca rosetta (strain ATCC 50818 / BSB-021) TaxID=946362 RepID=F2U2Y0_SALR5|nr:RING finger domain-containing protein containing protein [Salpingoeca rosetta]EGD81974.1 RING finger domain-containing protein containing protein [Salpingoeca rosetta]|eukprot:XP_004996157.1 RING finger domain-containing protein containing protein [Salpingoeca rosetta]
MMTDKQEEKSKAEAAQAAEVAEAKKGIDGTDATTTATGSDTLKKAGGAASCVFIKKKKRAKGTRANTRKRTTVQALAAEDDDIDEGALLEKRSKPVRGIGATTTKSKSKDDSLTVTYKSSRSKEFAGPKDMGATAELTIDTERDRDAQAVFERSQQQPGEEGEGMYRGLSAYRQLNQRKETVAGNAFKGVTSKGPVRAPLNIRSTVRWDYQPDICKDYKETGYCGFGDTCKFLHDRSDYKHGWQIDREIERGEYGKVDVRQYEIESDSDDEDELPFACFICRERFTHPVVTKCKHYFCEKCLLEHFRKSMNCPVCNEKTGGFFQPAKDIIERQKQLEDNGSDDNDEDDDDGNDSD